MLKQGYRTTIIFGHYASPCQRGQTLSIQCAKCSGIWGAKERCLQTWASRRGGVWEISREGIRESFTQVCILRMGGLLSLYGEQRLMLLYKGGPALKITKCSKPLSLISGEVSGDIQASYMATLQYQLRKPKKQ